MSDVTDIIEKVAAKWVSGNNESHKGERNALRRCNSLSDVMASKGSWRISALYHELIRNLPEEQKFSKNQVACMGWALSHVRTLDTSGQGSKKSLGHVMAQQGVNKNRIDTALNPRDRGKFVRQLIKVLPMVRKVPIPVSLAADVLYFGDTMKFQWRLDFDSIDLYSK